MGTYHFFHLKTLRIFPKLGSWFLSKHLQSRVTDRRPVKTGPRGLGWGFPLRKPSTPTALGGLNHQLKPLVLKLLSHQRELHWLTEKPAKPKPQTNPCSETLSGCSQPIEGNFSAPNPQSSSQSQDQSRLSHSPISFLLRSPPTPVPTHQPRPRKLHVLREPVTPLHYQHLALARRVVKS